MSTNRWSDSSLDNYNLANKNILFKELIYPRGSLPGTLPKSWTHGIGKRLSEDIPNNGRLVSINSILRLILQK